MTVYDNQATMLDPDLFDARMEARRRARQTYRRRLAGQLVTLAGVLAWCAVVFLIVWGVMA